MSVHTQNSNYDLIPVWPFLIHSRTKGGIVTRGMMGQTGKVSIVRDFP